ncbi:hypothetical protein JXO59_01265, partial [candidate division KSB1 bacterium]|nr:hypothetical protein [candidate division KSB1 bacterium]
MLSKIIKLIITIIIFLNAIIASAAFPRNGKKTTTGSINNLRELPHYTNHTLVNVNHVAQWIFSNGLSANEPNWNSGFYFPRGNKPKTCCIFCDGFIFGGLVDDGILPQIRIGGQYYFSAMVPGAIVSKGVGEDIQDKVHVDRIWRIRRDYAIIEPELLRQDAADLLQCDPEEITNKEITWLRDLYRQDWIDWPAYKGAPFYDADGDGLYAPQFNREGTPILFPEADEPGYADGDQVVWLVCNDLNDSLLLTQFHSPPIGVELQMTLWAYNRNNALGNVIFKQFRLIYKGRKETHEQAKIDSLHFSQWSDTEIGNAFDDLVGCDTLLSLGYAYNNTELDETYASVNLSPPAIGYTLLYGPIVPSPGGQATLNNRKIEGYKNLPMTGFYRVEITGENPCFSGDCLRLTWWNRLRGYRDYPLYPPEPFYTLEGKRAFYHYPGDPVKKTGWIDVFPYHDKRILLLSGSFSMAVKDTNDMQVAVIAGLGCDRLSSISIMKFYTRFIRQFFESDFVVSAPEPPRLRATELDRTILLNWGFDAESVQKIESRHTEGFFFEGYNIYQLPHESAANKQGIKIATFDVVNDITTILEESFDPSSGLLLSIPVQIAQNSGIKRTLLIDYDMIRKMPLTNGRTYAFAVSSYYYNFDPLASIKMIESPLSIVRAVPQQLKPGHRFRASIGDTIAIHHAGPSRGTVRVSIVDPSLITGDQYSIQFQGTPPDQTWCVINSTQCDTVLKNQVNQSGDENYLNVEGLLMIVIAPNSEEDIYTFYTNGLEPIYDLQTARTDVVKINVFPNPFYAFNRFEHDSDDHFVTITHLPQNATIRIFALDGRLIRTLNKGDDSQFIV